MIKKKGKKKDNPAANVLSWSALSKLISKTGSDNTIRANSYAKEYEREIEALLRLVNFWMKWRLKLRK